MTGLIASIVIFTINVTTGKYPTGTNLAII